MREWQDISTAPLTRPIEIAGYPYELGQGPHLLRIPSIWRPALFGSHWEGWNYRIPPSYWRHLPPPPKEQPNG